MTLLRELADGEDGRLMSQRYYLFLKKCRLFLKYLLNLLQYCFQFMFLLLLLLLLLLRGMWDLNTQPRDRTHTPCIERGSYSLDHLGSPLK